MSENAQLLTNVASGSGRRPGLWNGCFDMRPSHGFVSHSGLLSSFPRFDVPTFFGRELHKCRIFAEAWYGEYLAKKDAEESVSYFAAQTAFSDSPQKPISIVWASDYMDKIANERQLELLMEFAIYLETSCGIKHQAISFDRAWAACPPAAAGGASLSEYMKDVSRDSFFYADYHNFDAFRKEYREKYGKDAYVSPPVGWQWYAWDICAGRSPQLTTSRELSSHITSEAHDEAMTRLKVYKDWFDEAILKSDKQTTLILILIEEIAPRYRDEVPAAHFNPVGVPNLFLSPVLKAPELTVPSGCIHICP